MSKKSNVTTCTACFSPIADNARICRFCGTTQQPTAWSKIAGLLKWAGGIATVISLVAGALQLNVLLAQMHAKNRSFDTYIKAARNQFASGDMANAQLLLTEAAQLSPHSEQVRALQTVFLMQEIRQYMFSQWNHEHVYHLQVSMDKTGHVNYDFSYKADKKILLDYFNAQQAEKTLAVAAALSSGRQKANILAHLAWLDILFPGGRNQAELIRLFQQALALDAENVYANSMLAAWIAASDNKQTPPSEKFTRVQQHFKQARSENDQQWHWFQTMQFESLALLDSTQGDMRMLQLAMQPQKTPLSKAIAEYLLHVLTAYFLDLKVNPGLADQHREEIFNATFDIQQQLALIKMLGARARSCQQQTCLATQDADQEINFHQLKFLIHSKAGQPELMLEAFKKLQMNALKAGQIVDGKLRQMLIKQTPPMQPLQNFLVLRRNAYREELLAQDIIFELDGQQDIDKNSFKAAFKSRLDTLQVSFVRNGTLQKRVLSEYSMHAFDYLLPAKIADNTISAEQRQKLLKGWLN